MQSLSRNKNTPPSGQTALDPVRRKVIGSGLRKVLGQALGQALALTALATLAGCGQTGPLYRPDPNDPTKKRP